MYYKQYLLIYKIHFIDSINNDVFYSISMKNKVTATELSNENIPYLKRFSIYLNQYNFHWTYFGSYIYFIFFIFHPIIYEGIKRVPNLPISEICSKKLIKSLKITVKSIILEFLTRPLWTCGLFSFFLFSLHKQHC